MSYQKPRVRPEHPAGGDPAQRHLDTFRLSMVAYTHSPCVFKVFDKKGLFQFAYKKVWFVTCVAQYQAGRTVMCLLTVLKGTACDILCTISVSFYTIEVCWASQEAVIDV